MSADPFAPEATADPFAGDTPDAPPTADAPTEPTPEPTPEEIPTVNKEGEPVSPAPEAFDPVSQTVAEAPETAAEAPQAPEEVPAQPETPAEPSQAPVPTPEVPATPEDPGTGDVSPAVPAQPDATPQPETTPAPAEAATTEATPPAPRATGPRGGKGEMRHYKLLYQTGEKQWTEYDLTTVNQEDTGITVVKLPGDKPTDPEEVWFEARNNEHANRLSFTILGRPKEGVRIFPVPKGAYKPKTVKPAPPKPERERIVIS